MVSVGRRNLLCSLVPLALHLACRSQPVRQLPPERARAAAQIVGAAWLKRYLLEPSPQSLVDELTQGAPADEAPLKAFLLEKHLDDFVQGRTESVEGWILSATEVRLYALVALS